MVAETVDTKISHPSLSSRGLMFRDIALLSVDDPEVCRTIFDGDTSFDDSTPDSRELGSILFPKLRRGLFFLCGITCERETFVVLAHKS